MNGNETDGYSLEYGAFSETANLDVSIVSGESYYAVVEGESVTVTPFYTYTSPSGTQDPTDVSAEVKNVGVYSVTELTASFGEGTSKDNYEIILDNKVSFKIVAKAVTVDIKDITKVYGEANPVFGSDDWELAAGSMAYDEDETMLDVTLSLKGDGEDAGDYAITGEWNNSNYAVTFNEGTLTVKKRAVSFAVTNAQLPYNKHTVDDLPDPAGLGASATPTTLSYEDTVKVTFTYKTDKTTIVSAFKGEYDYIKTEITFLKSDGTTSADGNYTVTGEVKCMLVVVSGDLIINLDDYETAYDFAAGGITIPLSSVKVTVKSGAAVKPSLTAKILSSDGSTAYFFSEGGAVKITYVPSADKTATSVNLKFVVTAEAEGYETGSAEMTITVNKASFNLNGITFADEAAGYNGEAHEIGYTGTLPAGLTAEVTHTGDNVNHTEEGAKFTLTFDLTGEEHDEIIYYSYNLPEADTALLTINKAPVTITLKPQSSVYDGKTPAASAVAGTDYVITGTVYAQGGVLDVLGVKLTIAGGADAKNAGEYELSVSITNTNYALTAVNGTYTVTRRPVYVQLASAYASKVYGDKDPDWANNILFAVTILGTGEPDTGLVLNEGLSDVKITAITRAEGEAVVSGGYAVTVISAADSNYYVDSSMLRVFEILPRQITVVFNKEAFTSVYGEPLVMPNADDENQLKLKDGFALVGTEKDMTLAQAGFSIAFTGDFGGSAGDDGAEYTPSAFTARR